MNGFGSSDWLKHPKMLLNPCDFIPGMVVNTARVLSGDPPKLFRLTSVRAHLGNAFDPHDRPRVEWNGRWHNDDGGDDGIAVFFPNHRYGVIIRQLPDPSTLRRVADAMEAVLEQQQQEDAAV